MMFSFSELNKIVSTHSRLKAAGPPLPAPEPDELVSTHSRLKAAGQEMGLSAFHLCGFNTQPPEGGWDAGRLKSLLDKLVSTHSRLKAAGQPRNHALPVVRVSTHSRLKAAGR